jgi:hypothetical protein
MSASLRPLGNDLTFDERLQAKQAEVAATAVSAGRSFTQSMSELVQLQQTEILRLQTILRDNTVVPERYPVEVAIGSVLGRHDMLEHVLLAVASDRSVWLLENFKARAAPGLCKWVRVPGLPQVTDEMDNGA